MLVSVRFERGEGWILDENQAGYIPELKDVLVDPELGPLACCFIVMYADKTSFLNEIYTDEKIRLTKALKLVYGDKADEKVAKNKKVKAAIIVYEEISDTPFVQMQGKIQKATEKAVDFIDEMKDRLSPTNLKEFMEVLNKVPALLNNYSDMKKVRQEESNERKAIVRGERSLTPAEARKRKKK